jgi:bacterioferritin (cytochrome b1)
VRDRAVLGWVTNQFLYGEVSGIQCGHWLYAAPDLDAARFFARQAVEEFQHVDNFLRILEILGQKPAAPHRVVRFLGTGMMPATFEEHVCLEMALGEGFVLVALYAIIDTIDQSEIREILQRAVHQEERHVDFGERRTAAAIRERPALRRKLLGLSLVSMWAVRRVGRYLERKLPADHPVLHRLPEFLDFAVDCGELRLRRIGVIDAPLREISPARKAAAVVEAYGCNIAALPLRLLPRRRLTDTYLRDPLVSRAEDPRNDRRDGSIHIVR